MEPPKQHHQINKHEFEVCEAKGKASVITTASLKGELESQSALCSGVCKKPPRSVRKKLKRAQRMTDIKNMRKEKKLNAKMKRKMISEKSDEETEELKISPSSQNDINPQEKCSISVDKSLNTKLFRESLDEKEGVHVTKKAKLEEVKQRCKAAMKTGQRICIDCSLGDHMTQKECSKLAQQIGRLYGANRKYDKPAHIFLCGLDREAYIYQECVRKNSGFQDYLMDMLASSVAETFQTEDIIYLSPDSPNVLESIDVEKVYVIGGLIDESVKNCITVKKAQDLKVQTARLPIEEYMVKCKGNYSYSKILAVNQVFEILLTFIETGDWRQALQAGIPKRKGFVVKEKI